MQLTKKEFIASKSS